MRFFSHRLSNGLRLLYCPISNTRMTTVNLMYNVGSKDEHPDHTGFAHLFEHLMRWINPLALPFIHERIDLVLDELLHGAADGIVFLRELHRVS